MSTPGQSKMPISSVNAPVSQSSDLPHPTGVSAFSSPTGAPTHSTPKSCSGDPVCLNAIQYSSECEAIAKNVSGYKKGLCVRVNGAGLSNNFYSSLVLINIFN